MKVGQWAAPALLMALGASSCFYNFNNPVAKLPNGSISGQLVLIGAAQGQTVAGATVTLQWSGLHVDVDSSGRFIFLGLPDGTFTLRYQVPPAQPGGLPFIGFRHDLLIPANGSGTDAISLGDLTVDLAAVVEGDVIGAQGPVVVAAFRPSSPGGEPGEFEGISTTIDPSVSTHYQLVLPAGAHEIAASSATSSASKAVSLQPRDQLGGQDLSVTVPADPTATLTGFLVLGGFGASAEPGSSVDNVLMSIVANTTPEGQPTQMVPGFSTPVQAAGAGAEFTQPLTPAGLRFQFTCTIAAAQPPETFIGPLTIHTLPAIAGRKTNLGQIPWLPDSTFAANSPDGGTSDGG
jgi:hypothetical protein